MDQSQAQDTAAETEPARHKHPRPRGPGLASARSYFSVHVSIVVMSSKRSRCNGSPFQMVLDKRRHGADLNGVRVVGRVLKQTVVGIKQLLGQEEEKLSGRAAVVQSEDTRAQTGRGHFLH